jgi:hypothetical protein
VNIKYISRKFLLSAVVQMLLFVFLYIGKLPVENFQILTMTILTCYLASNVIQKSVTKEASDESKV